MTPEMLRCRLSGLLSFPVSVHPTCIHAGTWDCTSVDISSIGNLLVVCHYLGLSNSQRQACSVVVLQPDHPPYPISTFHQNPRRIGNEHRILVNIVPC